MKKILTLCTVLFILVSKTVFAEPMTNIEFSDVQNIKAGEKVTISVNVKDTKSLYALDLKYLYNSEDIKVTGLYKGQMLIDADYGFMDSSGQPIEEGKEARYYFTFTGEKPGVDGDGEIIKIEIEALKDTELKLNKDNIDMILVSIDKNFEVAKMGYKLVGTDGEVVVVQGDEVESVNTSVATTKSSSKSNIAIGLIGVAMVFALGRLYIKKRNVKNQ